MFWFKDDLWEKMLIFLACDEVRGFCRVNFWVWVMRKVKCVEDFLEFMY